MGTRFRDRRSADVGRRVLRAVSFTDLTAAAYKCGGELAKSSRTTRISPVSSPAGSYTRIQHDPSNCRELSSILSGAFGSDSPSGFVGLALAGFRLGLAGASITA